jgi:hypothetical protein
MMRNLFTSLHNTENHPLVKSDLARRRDKAMREQPTKAVALMHIITQQEVRSPGGLYLGLAPAFNLDDPRVDRFLERVCRGVLFDSCNKGYFSGTFSWKMLPSEFVSNLFQSAPKECPQRSFGDIFSYVVLTKDGIVLLRFYEGFAAAGTFTPTIDLTGAK